MKKWAHMSYGKRSEGVEHRGQWVAVASGASRVVKEGLPVATPTKKARLLPEHPSSQLGW